MHGEKLNEEYFVAEKVVCELEQSDFSKTVSQNAANQINFSDLFIPTTFISEEN